VAGEIDSETRAAEAQARERTDAERVVAEATATVLSAAQQLQAERRRYEALRSEHQAILDSISWRASAPLRIVGSWFPSFVKRAARGGLKVIYWVLTPWATSRRVRFYRQRSIQQEAVASGIGNGSGSGSGSAPEGLGSTLSIEPRILPSLLPANAALSIAYVSGEPDTPGHQYRIERYAAAAVANGCSVVLIRGDELSHRLHELWSADVLVIWRMSWSKDLAVAVEQMRARRKTVVFDIDDLMVDPGLAQVGIIDGIRSQSLTEDSVRQHYTAVRQTMLAADICFAATDELALHMRRADKVVHVLPNGFDSATHNASRLAARRWRQLRRDKLIRLGYAGGSRTHQRDLGLAVDAIARLLEEYPEARLVLFRSADGRHPIIDVEEFPALRDLTNRIEWRPLRRLSELPEEIARFDINLAPLEFGNPFCEAKSELKFFEAGLVDVPTIASPTGPYRRAIEHGKTGFLAAGTEDWYAYGKRLIEEPELRARIGRDAYYVALARFGSMARTTHFGRVIAQLRGGMSAAHAFALHTQLSVKSASRPEIFPYDTVFEHDELGSADVTVVMPLYNYDHYVVEALDSVREQTLRALDLVVVDDRSTDRSLRVVTDWARKNEGRFNRIQVLKNRSNYGLALSRNTGFDAAGTTYVLPLDADNKLLPECCETLLNAIRVSGAAFAYGMVQRFGDKDGLINADRYDGQRFVGGNYIDAMALVSKEAWAAIGGYHHIQFGWEDYDFWCRLAEHGLAGAWHSDVLALYRVHGTSMLRTQTDVRVNHRRLVEDFKTRHPWVSLVAQEQLLERPRQAVRVSERPEFGRLRKLLPLLRCPDTKQRLTLDESSSELASVDGRRRWPIVNGRPVLSPALSSPEIRNIDHVSNSLPDNATELIRGASGLVLNLSAGGTARKFEHVVEVEYAIFRHTDIVGDAHQLPFDDDTFEAVVVMNAFEHYRDPAKVATELHRILKPGGRVLIHTAFIQPLHERPWHFFNCTRYGLEEWFKAFETEVLRVSDNFSPGHSVAWLASEAEAALRSDISAQSAEAFSAAHLGQFAEMWRDPSKRTGPLWDNFYRLSQTSQEVTAAGFEFVGRKPQQRPRR
jgi:GT2 family glycosyltransferase/glycosyltransferase involved in cell wall biosynthesis/SAM-dependent methyltransferase/uncharacterized protein YbaR (Trm112 family)